MDLDSLLDATMLRAGLADPAEGTLAVEATLEALAGCLPALDAADLEAALPPVLAPAVRRGVGQRDIERDELVARVSRKERVRPGQAVEHVEAVCEALAAHLDPELLARLQLHLPADLAVLFASRQFEAAAPPVRPGQGRTLATGRPGSTHPISEAADTSRAQRDSVVRADNPHGDRKMSSGGADFAGRTLATARPGSSVPLSEATTEPRDRRR